MTILPRQFKSFPYLWGPRKKVNIGLTLANSKWTKSNTKILEFTLRQTNNFTLWKRFHCGSFHATEKLWHYYRQQQPQRNLILVKRQRSSHTHHTRTDRLEEQPAAASRRVSVEKTELEKKPEFYVCSTAFGPSEFGLMRHPRKSCRIVSELLQTIYSHYYPIDANWYVNLLPSHE